MSENQQKITVDVVTIGILTVSLVLSIIVLVPIKSLPLGVDIDRSWAYALADAARRCIPFGKDVIFTFGPLSSIYSGLFLPSQALYVVVFRAILICIIFFLFGISATRSSRWLITLFPLLLANIFTIDSFFFFSCWVVVPAFLEERNMRHSGMIYGSMLILSVLLAPIALVKGSLAVPLTTSIFICSVWVWHKKRIVSILIPLSFLSSVILCWILIGQSPIDILYYFKRQSYVISGYTNAMSISGDMSEVLYYVLGAVVILAISLEINRASVLIAISLASILFVAFKSGFVRHDAHAMIAASTILLVTYFLFLQRWNLKSFFGFCVGCAVWMYIGNHYMAIDPISDMGRVALSIRQKSTDLVLSSKESSYLSQDLNSQRSMISEEFNLPRVEGVVDLYPNLESIPLASDNTYYPRPAVQSYTAYTPELAFLDAEHLNGPHAPSTVLFDIAPLDQRYPALEDGPSWPALLGQYRFRAFNHQMGLFDRIDGSHPDEIGGKTFDRLVPFDQNIPIAQDKDFVWAKIQFHPTLVGKIISTIFKLPALKIIVTNEDGKDRQYRLIAGMASAGFLLSPSVIDVHDFIALHAANQEALSQRRVKSIRIVQEGGGALWGDEFEMQLASFRTYKDPSLDQLALGYLEGGQDVSTLSQAGDCNIDTVAGLNIAGSELKIPWQTAVVNGWGYLSASKGVDGGHLKIAVTPEGGSTMYADADRTPRSDVDAHFKISKPTRSGFTARVNLSVVKTSATIQIVETGPNGLFACGRPVTVSR